MTVREGPLELREAVCFLAAYLETAEPSEESLFAVACLEALCESVIGSPLADVLRDEFGPDWRQL